MSDYKYEKVVRYKLNIKELGLNDIYDLEELHSDKFGCGGEVGKFDIAPTEEPFIDFVLAESYGEECGDYGRSRKLSEKELEKYVDKFSEILPNINPDNFRVVEFCWYNCSEAPGYFDEIENEFFKEV